MGEALWATDHPPNPRAPVLLVHLEPQRLVGGGSSGRPPPSLACLECCALVAGVFCYCLSLTVVPVAVGRDLGQTLVLAAAAACYFLSPILVLVAVGMEGGVGGGLMAEPSPQPVPALLFLVAVLVSPVCREPAAALIVWGVL